MASRTETYCTGCGRRLWVPPEAIAITCSACQAITRIQPVESVGQPYGSVVRAPRPGRLNSINWAPAPAGSGRYTNPGSGNYNNFANRDTVASNYMNNTAGRPVNNGSYPVAGTYGDSNNDYADGLRPRPALPAPSVHGRKRAVLCGINYYQTNYTLSGCIADVKKMMIFLIETLKFPSDCILTLTEEEMSPERIPTKKNMRSAMRWLVQGCQPGDKLFFHYSGHGKKQKDYNGDEFDGIDETLCPLDHETEGPIIDDEVNQTLVRPLPHGAKLHAVIDTCFSGTILDLPFLCKMNREGNYVWEDHRTPMAGYKSTSGGNAFCFSACNDDQTSSTTSVLTGREVTGAMTASFIQVVRNEPGSTYGRLLNAMRNAIPSLVATNTKLQEPQLSSSKKFDIYSRQFKV